MLLNFLVDHPANAFLDNASVTSDICSKIVKAFDDDAVDIAMVMDVNNHRSILAESLVAEFDVEFAWMQAENFTHEPNAPIPLATWPPDRHIILNALAEDGRAYKVMFAGPDYSSKFTAVRSGQCLAVVPRNAIALPFVEAKHELLPPIASKKILLGVSGDPNSERYKHIVSVLSSFRLAGIQSVQRQ